jgi:high-affinity iron transporter
MLVGAALAVLPVAAAATAIALLPASRSAHQTVTVTADSCAKDWTAAQAGAQTISVRNQSSKAGEINLVDSGGGLIAEIETIGPATTADMTATLGRGRYTIRCLMSGRSALSSATVQVVGAAGGPTPRPVLPVTEQDLDGPNRAYQAYVTGVLGELTGQVATVRADLARGDLDTARTDWFAAQLDWERVGASYDSFGDPGIAVDGLPSGLPGGVDDPGFTGLHRLEYGLWHGQSADQLIPVTDRLAADIGTVTSKLNDDDLAGDPTALPLRPHEILEDALRDHLSSIDDLGSGATYAEIDADVAVTRIVLHEFDAPLQVRAPTLATEADRELDALSTALDAAKVNGDWPPPQQTPASARIAVQSALDSALETLSQVPLLLELPPTH